MPLPSGSCSTSETAITKPLAGEIEPELYGLLEWLAEQSVHAAENMRHQRRLVEKILGYRDSNTSRGVAYGALWAALVRAAAVYTLADGKTIDAGSEISGGASLKADTQA